MSEKQFDCIGIGISPYDYTLLMDEYPEPNSKHVARQVSTGGGGPASNAVYTLAKLGCKTGFATTMGDDFHGNYILQELQEAGVNTSGIRLDQDIETLHAHIIVDRSTGGRTVILNSNDLPEITVDQIPDDLLTGTKLITLDSRPSPGIIKAVKQAKSEGARVMLDAGSVQKFLDELLPLIDYPVTSQNFIADLFGNTDPVAGAEALLDVGATIAGVTLGANGSILANRNETVEIPAFQVDVADSTGAGDLYHGGILFGILQGWPLRPTGEFASAVAAIGCRYIGARSYIPDLPEISEFMRSNGIVRHPLFSMTGEKE